MPAVTRGAAIAAALLLSGCALLRSGPGTVPPLLPPAGYAASKTLQQQVSVTHGGETRVYTALVRIGPDTVTMIGFGLLGARLFSMSWNGRDLHTQGRSRLPPALSPAWLVADVQTVYAPLSALRALFAGSGWDVAQPRPGTRTLTQGGEVRVRVTYAENTPETDTVTIRHVARDLAIHIVSRPIPYR